MRRIAPILIAAFLLTGCFASPPPVVPAEPAEPTSARADVPWDDYSADVKTRIDDATQNADCDALQKEFDTADANNDATAARTDHNNAALMTYIDEALKLAGCY